MTEKEVVEWSEEFAIWCVRLRLELGDDNHSLRACRLILSELIDAQASVATVSHVLTLIEKEFVRARMYGGVAATEGAENSFREAMKGAKTRTTNEETNEEALPKLLHARLPRTDVKSLRKVDDEVELAQTISDLIDTGFLQSELQLVLDRNLEDGFEVGIARTNLLLALLLKADLISGHRRPSSELLHWLGRQCCAWPGAGKFVNFAYQVFFSWTPEQWSRVDVNQVAGFLSGVLQSTLDYLREDYKNATKIAVEVTTLIRVLEKLVFERFEPKDFDSEHVKHCLKLLELLKHQPGVQM